jgi:hypothetical protein
MGLLVLWLAGIRMHSVGWQMWLVFAGGCLSLLGALYTPADASRGRLRIVPLAISIGLYALWFIGRKVGNASWKNWWIFAFACAYLLVALAEASIRQQRPIRRAS